MRAFHFFGMKLVAQHSILKLSSTYKWSLSFFSYLESRAGCWGFSLIDRQWGQKGFQKFKKTVKAILDTRHTTTYTSMGQSSLRSASGILLRYFLCQNVDKCR